MPCLAPRRDWPSARHAKLVGLRASCLDWCPEQQQLPTQSMPHLHLCFFTGYSAAARRRYDAACPFVPQAQPMSATAKARSQRFVVSVGGHHCRGGNAREPNLLNRVDNNPVHRYGFMIGERQRTVKAQPHLS